MHDGQGRILRANQRLSHLLGRDFNALIGRGVSQLLRKNGVSYDVCPYCEGVAGEGDDPDPGCAAISSLPIPRSPTLLGIRSALSMS